MRLLVSLIVLCLFGSPECSGQSPEKFTGRLDPQLSPDMVHLSSQVFTASGTGQQNQVLPISPEIGSAVFFGELIDEGAPKGCCTRALLVEPPASAPYLWFDANHNGVFDKLERFPLMPLDGSAEVFSATLHLSIKNIFYDDFPIYIQYRRGLIDRRLKATDRLISQTYYVLANARVKINSREVLFMYPFGSHETPISTTEGLFGVDVDGDGRIRNEQFSVETSYSAQDESVFPVGDMYVSTSAIDMKTGRVTVRRRDKSEYTRVDLFVGGGMPDFAFIDIDGKDRRLSDFKGKYLLVDFWGVWCHDCTRETPYQLAAYERFKNRGFEILGIDSDEKVDVLRAYLVKNNITWPQATNTSTKKLRDNLYRIQEYPSAVLLDPQGRVLVLNQQRLQGDKLLNTLDSVLPNP